MFHKHMNVSVACRCFQAVKHVAEILAEIILNKRAGLQFQRTEIAESAQFCWDFPLVDITRVALMEFLLKNIISAVT